MLAALGMLAAAAVAGADMAPVAPGGIEGRPAPFESSSLQSLIDGTRAGETLDVDPGRYEGDLIIDHPMRLVGHGRPLLLGSGHGSVVRVRAAGVVVEGFDIDGKGGGDLGRDASGIHVAARGAIIRDCRVRNCLFGVYLREADGTEVANCTIEGIPGKEPGEKGSGIHVWNTVGFEFTNNVIREVRDGFYIQSSSHGVIRGNTAKDLRYGLHYMFSDDNVFEDNLFENGAAGTALMYSKHIVFRRNRFVRNRGFASVGLLFKACDDVLAESNLVADNARGIFLEGSYRNTFRGNVVAASDVAIVLYDSCGGNVFEGNSFVGNLSPLTLVGKRTDTRFDGNYWSENDEPDLDGDGRSDRSYRLTNVFDHLRGNVLAADLFAQGFAAAVLGLAERAFPVLDPIEALDHVPLVRPPVLPAVPTDDRTGRHTHATGLLVSLALLGAGVLALAWGRR